MIKFMKMHGIGNDYIYIDCFQEKIDNPGEIAIKLSDRHFGIGGDGIVLILPSEVADCKMDMYNADGSQAKMCGNAIRCVAKYLFDQGMIEDIKVSIDTLSGIKKLKLNLRNGLLTDITVDMGAPILEPELIPVRYGKTKTGLSDARLKANGLAKMNLTDIIISEPVDVDGKIYDITCVSMGNPHAIIFVDEVKTAPVEKIGGLIENLAIFPDRINVEFVEIIDDSTIKMRVWERGSGETLACGTGACASVVACVLNNKTKREVCVKLTGGELDINWDESKNTVFMTGPAKKVFHGYVDMKDF